MKNSNKTYETFCPLFQGFYGTLFEYDGEGEDVRIYNEEFETNFDYEDFEWDYREYEKRIGKAFVNRLENELKSIIDISIEFEEIYSPKEYNFTNDSINVKVTIDLDKLIELVSDKKTLAAEYFKNKYTSCSGFISFHSNKVEDWINKDYILENSAHRIGALLDCLCHIQEEFEIDPENLYYWCDSEYYIDFYQKELN